MVFLAAIFWVLVTWLVFAFLAAIPAWALWNWLMPTIFGVTSLTLSQAFGLLILLSLLFGSRPEIRLEHS